MPRQHDIYEVLANCTKTLAFVSSGAVAGTISSALIDRNETLISSVAASDSGNGHYYAVMAHPGSAQWVVNEWRAVINGSTYIGRQFGKVVTMEVD
jgi:hypothetical protein